MALIIKKESFNTESYNIFYPGNETNYYCQIDGIKVAWCEGAMRQKMNSGMSYFLSVIEVEKEYKNKGYSRKDFDHIYNDLGLPITPININNPEYWEYIW